MAFLLNLGLAFVEGFALILSPCILPILPIMLSGGIEGGRRRPYGIIAGFVLVFALFTLVSRLLVQHLGINLDWVRYGAFALIALFGIILISDGLSAQFEHWTQRLANMGMTASAKNDSSAGGFCSGVLLGGLVSLIWVPCGGPILAAAIVQSAIQESNWASFFSFLFFALGSVLPMIIIALLGRTILQRLAFLKKNSGRLRKVFGLIILVGALLALAPARISSTPIVTSMNENAPGILVDALSSPYPAPALAGAPTDWINSPPLTLADLKGKVVLIDFWTYSCINCVRTLPYLNNWYAQYHDKGLVIIGVHTPEFEFEKNRSNVVQAVQEDGILYPVMMDSNYATWLNYHNEYWPAHYLIDKQGNVVYQHFGEGNDAQTEHNIRVLLGLHGDLSKPLPNPAVTSFFSVQSPETYLGAARANAHQDLWSTQGGWTSQDQYIMSTQPNASITLQFTAQKVFLVGGTADKPIMVTVQLNGKTLRRFTLTRHDLYPVLSLPQQSAGSLTLHFSNPGAQLYTFTFG